MIVPVSVVKFPGMNGNLGHGSTVCGPRILSNTMPMYMPATIPTLYEKVMILPVASFKVAGTLHGANIIDNEAANPLVVPNAAVKMKAGVSPEITGWDLGVQHNKSRTTKNERIIVSSTN